MIDMSIPANWGREAARAALAEPHRFRCAAEKLNALRSALEAVKEHYGVIADGAVAHIVEQVFPEAK